MILLHGPRGLPPTFFPFFGPSVRLAAVAEAGRSQHKASKVVSPALDTFKKPLGPYKLRPQDRQTKGDNDHGGDERQKNSGNP
jgi:hypothetical protein